MRVALAARVLPMGLRPFSSSRWTERGSRTGSGFSGFQLQRRTNGPGRRDHPLAHGLPHYRIARKTEEELAAELASDTATGSGGRFPFKDEFEITREMILTAKQVTDALAPLMTQERMDRIAEVCASRTFNVLPIVESCYDMGNLAAVCRSADALGFGAVHVVRNLHDERYKQSTRSAAGSDKWLDVQLWDTTEACLSHAKKLGYQVVVTHLSPESVDISQVDWTKPTAFVMGNEEKGVSEKAVEMADVCAVVPMVGFVESFNISVAAALIMYEARRCREQKLGAHGDLTEREQELLRAVFYLRNKGQTREYIRNLLERPPPQWQKHRGGGDWGSKSFNLSDGPLSSMGSSSSGSSSDGESDSAAAGASAAAATEPAAALAATSIGEQLPLLRQRLQTTQCHYWDGRCCWGERYFWPGKPCRYILAHNENVNTLDTEKLRQMCEKKGMPFPDLANPPPQPALAPRFTAVTAAVEAEKAARAAAAAAAAAEEEARLREVHDALLAVAGCAGADSSSDVAAEVPAEPVNAAL